MSVFGRRVCTTLITVILTHVYVFVTVLGLEPGIFNILKSGEHETPSMQLTPAVYDSFIIQLNLLNSYHYRHTRSLLECIQ